MNECRTSYRQYEIQNKGRRIGWLVIAIYWGQETCYWVLLVLLVVIKKIGSLLCMFLYTVQVRLCRTMFWFSYCVPLKMAQSQNSHLAQKPCEKLNIWKFITLCQINSKQYYWYHWNQNKRICWEIPPLLSFCRIKKNHFRVPTPSPRQDELLTEFMMGVCGWLFNSINTLPYWIFQHCGVGWISRCDRVKVCFSVLPSQHL